MQICVGAFLVGAFMNNIQFFDEMNISNSEKSKRVKMTDSFQKQILNVLKWAYSVDRSYLKFQLPKKFRESYTQFLGDWMIDYMYISYEYMQAWIDNVSRSTISMIDDYDRKELENAASEELPYVFSEERASVIARNEVNYVCNSKTHVDKVHEGYTQHIWLSEVDDKTRPWHLMANGQTKPIYEPFNVGGVKMMFPMDTSYGAGADNIINCRCVEQFLR